LYSAVGRRLPAHATALGKAILATLPEEAVGGLVRQPMPALTKNTITTLDHFREDLQTTRERGYAIDKEESSDGIYCLAVALTAPGANRTAISCSVPTSRMSDERMDLVLSTLLEAKTRTDALLSQSSGAPSTLALSVS
jgi:DNA-binding IclR family transcriptional regulator